MKHLLSAADLSRDEAIQLLDIARAMAATQTREIKKLPTLRGRTVVNLFFEDSTRTRISFEAAAKRLSADVINFSAKGSSVSKGESLKDTALTLEAMGADAVVIRHQASGAPHRLAHSNWISAGVVNAGDGTHQHPTQALLDAFTMREHLSAVPAETASEDAGPGGTGSRGTGSGGTGPKGTRAEAAGAGGTGPKEAGSGDAGPSGAGSVSAGSDGQGPKGADLAGRRVVIVGDVLHSRVARSNVDLLTTLGAQVTLVAPPTLLPVGVETWPCATSLDLDQTLGEWGPDVVMMLRVQRERMAGGAGAFFPSPQEYSRYYGLDSRRLAQLQPHALVMHPGPMNRGLEISAEAADSPRSTIVEQVTNGVYIRMAVLFSLLAGQDEIEQTWKAGA